jgi:xylulose-5-phosphate/fructose-6-phosphate phosphoketolase
VTNEALTPELLRKMHAYWRAANYLSVGQIYLYDNPLLRRPLRLSDIKPLVVGHWGTTPGQNFIYVHLNRVIKKVRLGYVLHRRARSRRSCSGGKCLSRRHLYRDLSRHHPRRSGNEKAFQTIFVSRRNFQPCCTDDSGVDSRRRRAGLFTQPCLRCRVRQSRTDCGLCHRRW